MAFAYPGDLIPVIQARWEEGRRRGSVMPTDRLPPPEIIRTVLEMAYHLSFQTEEQRRIQCQIALCSPDLVDAVHNPALEQVVFRPPRPFTLAELLQLAPAADPSVALIGVEPRSGGSGPRAEGGACQAADGGLRAEDRLQIWGLVNIGSDWWEFSHGSGLGPAVFPPPCLIVSVMEPGSISVSWGGLVLATLRDGRVALPQENPLHRGPAARFLAPGAEAFARAVLRELGLDRWDPEGEDEEYPQRFYRHYLERLAHHIRMRQHGGTVLLVPGGVSPEDRWMARRVAFKYVAPAPGVWELLVRCLVLRRRLADRQGQMERAETIAGAEFRALQDLSLELQAVERALSESVRFLAALAAVDGALVLNDRYQLLGFGAEVIAMAPELRTIRLARDALARETEPWPIDAFGTRHRSALRFCYHCPDALAVIVSQDGDVRVARRVGDDVVLWPEVTLGELGI